MKSFTDTTSNENKEENKKGLTPRQLIQRHMEHPENPITEEDLNNLRLNDKPATTEEDYTAEVAD